MTTIVIDSELVLRDNEWLAERVSLLRQVHFADVPQGFPITTRFGIRARNRFGSIGAHGRQTIILVNRLFADSFVPTFVVDGTLAHELAHYAHGYGSGLPLIHRNPHRGGVVDKELECRGLGEINQKAAQWRTLHWDEFYRSRCADIDARRTVRKVTVDSRWTAALARPGSRSESELHVRLSLIAPRFGFLEAPFGIEWLRATPRQTAPSYWFSRSRMVRIHGLVADPRVPLSLLEYEIAYWLARQIAGDSAHKIQRALSLAGLADTADRAICWRRRSWTAFHNRYHPLRP
jgi:hypothetical protein